MKRITKRYDRATGRWVEASVSPEVSRRLDEQAAGWFSPDGEPRYVAELLKASKSKPAEHEPCAQT